MVRTNINPGTTAFLFIPIFLAFWLSLPVCGYSQKPSDRDSILNEYRTTTEDTTKVNNLLDLGFTYLRTNTDSANLFAEKALALADSIAFLRGTAKAYKDFRADTMGKK